MVEIVGGHERNPLFRTSARLLPAGGRSRVVGGRSALVVGAVAVLAAGSVVATLLPAAQAQVAKTPATKSRVIKDPAIVESSSLARSYYVKSRLWTANDSGGGTTIYAIGKRGGTTAKFELRGASHKDWEGMARTVIHGVSYLYVGDIGDNGKKRSSIFVHRLKEPKPSRHHGSVKYKTYEFKYPDGAHNAEGLMVKPGRSHRLFIVSKGKKVDGAIYRAPKKLSTSGVNWLKKVQTAPPGMSDAVFLPGGRFILRGYVNGWLYKKIGATPTGFALPIKGESITTARNKDFVFVGQEGRRSSIWRVKLP